MSARYLIGNPRVETPGRAVRRCNTCARRATHVEIHTEPTVLLRHSGLIERGARTVRTFFCPTHRGPR